MCNIYIYGLNANIYTIPKKQFMDKETSFSLDDIKTIKIMSALNTCDK